MTFQGAVIWLSLRPSDFLLFLASMYKLYSYLLLLLLVVVVAAAAIVEEEEEFLTIGNIKVWTETKLLCNETELKWCNKTEIRWNKKLSWWLLSEQTMNCDLMRRNCYVDLCNGRGDPACYCSSSIYNYKNHRLNGSSSPVLTATCLSYGRLCDFLTFFPPTDLEVTPLDRFWRKMAQTTWIHEHMCLLG